MGIFDILSPALANPKMAAQLGSPLLSALLMKHGKGGGGGLGPAAGPGAVGPAPTVDLPLGDTGENAANAVAALPSFGGGNAIMDQLPDAPGLDLGAGGGMDGIRGALAANAAKPRGFLDRIGDFVKSDEGRAALLRSGAQTLATGNIGAGIRAGADFVDGRRMERKKDAAGAREAWMDERRFGLDERREDNMNAYRLGGLDLQAEQTAETARHNRAGEGNDVYRERGQNWRHSTPSGTAALGAKVDVYQHGTASGGQRLAADTQRYTHDNPSGDTIASQAGQNYRATLPNAGPRAMTTTREEYEAQPERTEGGFLGIGGRTIAATPKRTVQTVRPSEVQPGPNAGPQRIASDAEYEALPSGTQFVGPDGIPRIKP